jgi:hypothetical protein
MLPCITYSKKKIIPQAQPRFLCSPCAHSAYIMHKSVHCQDCFSSSSLAQLPSSAGKCIWKTSTNPSSNTHSQNFTTNPTLPYPAAQRETSTNPTLPYPAPSKEKSPNTNPTLPYPTPWGTTLTKPQHSPASRAESRK